MTRGRFVVLEGGEGVGKSTQAALLAEELDALLTREPGDTPLGAQLRAILLAGSDPTASEGGAPLDDRTEALLMAADRAQHVVEVIEPALAAGRDVVCDRYIGSSVAYQGYGRELDVDIVRAVSGWAAGGLWPDLVILLDGPDTVGRERIGAGRDRIETAGADFHQRVLQGFREQAEDDTDTWVVVDAAGSVDDVSERVLDVVQTRLGLR